MSLDSIKLAKYVTEQRPQELECSSLVHGDLWSNNVIIERNDDESISNKFLALIDWQTAFLGLFFK
jgi:aminoglycoside phosphotransferase (APT) family kinase protein